MWLKEFVLSGLVLLLLSNNSFSQIQNNIPGRIEAENWSTKAGYQYATATTDSGGGLKMVGISNQSWMDYTVNVLFTGNYTIGFRIATTQNHAQFQVKSGDIVLSTVNIPGTGDWNNWITITVTGVPLTAGLQTLRILSTNTETCDVNWMQFILPNQPPTANAGTAQVINLPSTQVTLSGSGNDPEGGILTYAWTQISGTLAAITNPSSASTTITGLTTAGVRVFRLTVIDNQGASATNDVTVTVNAVVSNGKTIPGRIEAESWDNKSGYQYAVPVTDAGGGLKVVNISNGSWLEYNVTVAETGTYTIGFRTATTQSHAQFLVESGNTILATVNFPGTGGWDNWSTVSVNDVPLTAGNQTIRILSTNNESCDFNWMDFAVTGTGENQAPVANAGADQNITLPVTTVTLTGSATDADGNIAFYTWTQISGITATITNPASAVTSITNLNTTGITIFRLTVTDNDGASATSDVNVTVNPTAAPGTGGQLKMGMGKYVTLFIHPDTKQLWAIGNRGFTGVGGNTSGAGSSAIPERVIVTPADLKFKSAAGSFHSGAAIDTAGNVWTMGETAGGVSGMGNSVYSITPQKILVDTHGNPFTNITSITAIVQNGAENTSKNGWMALKEDGTLWVWGTVGSMLGDGTENIDFVVGRPTQVNVDGKLVKEIAGAYHCEVLCTDSTVYTWGTVTEIRNLGYDVSGVEYRTPHQLNLTGIVQIEGGNGFNWGLKADGTLYAWGSKGNLIGDTSNSVGYGNAIITPRTVPVITNAFSSPITKIITSSMTTMFLLADSSLWCVGDNTQGTVGNGQEYYGNPSTGYGWDGGLIGLLVKVPYHIAPTKKFIDMFSGSKLVFWNYALDKDNKLYAWGTNKGCTIANKIITAATGIIEGQYPNGFDVTWPTPVDPFNIVQQYIATCPICITDSTQPSCANYRVPANTRPVPNAGNNQSITTSFTLLDGTASTDNVYIMYYRWSQVSGPNTAVMDLPASPTPRVYGLITGVYVFRLKTTDNGWLSDSAGVQITVNGGTYTNLAPVVNAGTAQTILAPRSFTTLTGSATDLDGRIISYLWSQISGPNTATFTNANIAINNVTGLVIGVYTFRLTVTDNNNATSTSDIIITVTNNHSPLSNAGKGITVVLPDTTTTLYGSGSDIDNDPISFAWTQTFGATATIVSPASATTLITGLAPGTYKFLLTVTDSNGDSATSEVAVAVNGLIVNTGDNSYPKVGLGVAEYGTFFIDTLHHLTAIGNKQLIGVGTGVATGNTSIPMDVVSLPGLKFNSASGGFHFGGAIDTSGYVWTMGDASGGIAGNGSPTYNKNAQLITIDADGAPFNNVMMIVACVQNESEGTPLNAWMAVKHDGSLWVWGTPGPMHGDSSNTTDIISRPTRVIMPGTVKMVTGGNYVQALMTNGDVYTWGDGDANNLGYAYTGAEWLKPHKLPELSGINWIAGGKGFNYAVRNDGKLFGWGFFGDNLCDQAIPNGFSYAPYPHPTELTYIESHLPANVSRIWTNYSATYAILTDSTLYSWGDNTQGLIGNGDGYYGNPVTGYNWPFEAHIVVKTPYHVAPTKKFINLFTGNTLVFRVFALMSDKKILAWGTNKGSVLGDRISSIAITGVIQSTYGNSWDRKWPTPIDPFNIHTEYLSTSPACVINPNAPACSEYIIPANTKPVANAGNNQTTSSSAITLNGSGSTDNVFIAYYEWTQIAGVAAVIDLPASSTSTISGLTNGVHIFKLKVTDNGWLTDSANITITVAGGVNNFPVANAGINQSIQLPVTSLTLSGSGTDADGTIVIYSWTQISGASANIINPSNPSTNITGLTNVGVRVFKLTVTDNSGDTASSSVTVTVIIAAYDGKTIPGRIEAENWDAKSGYQYAVTTNDPDGGGQHVVGISNGSWLEYYVNVLYAGTYTVNFRVATTQALSQFQLILGNTLLGTINIPNTGGWDTWLSASIPITLAPGAQTLRILSTNTESCNLNWMDFQLSSQLIAGKIAVADEQTSIPVLPTPDHANSISVFPNPSMDQFVLRIYNKYEGTMQIQILDANGRIKKDISAVKNKGRNEISFSANGMAPGMYTIRVKMGELIQSIKMIRL